MKNIGFRVLSVMLAVALLFGCTVPAFAAAEAVTPVIVVNDLDYNPFFDAETEEEVFNVKEYKANLPFTHGLPTAFYEELDIEKIKQMLSGELSALDIITFVGDGLGYTQDIADLVPTVLEIATLIIGELDLTNIDVQAILKSIDLQQVAKTIAERLKARYDNLQRLKLDENGEPVDDGVVIHSYEEPIDEYMSDDYDLLVGPIAMAAGEKIDEENVWVYTYDWRLDPVKNAAGLADLVNTVKAASETGKVNIISEGYGSVIATTYLHDFASEAADSVNSFVTVSSAFEGTSLAGDIFSGNLVDKYTAYRSYSSALVRWFNDMSDNPLTALANWIAVYSLNREWEIQSLAGDIAQFVQIVSSDYVNFGIADVFFSMPGMWALVPYDQYEDAYDNIFGDEGASTAVTEQLDAFKDLQSDADSILQDAQDDGIKVSVVAQWDVQLFPIGKTDSVQSDGLVDTTYASFGATCVDLNNVAAAYKAVQEDDLDHDHLSDDYDMLTVTHVGGTICHYIDASTCALPENTWFIRNMKHGTFNEESNAAEFLMWLADTDTQRTVWTDAAYPQFMNYNRYVQPGQLNPTGPVHNPVEDNPGKPLKGDVDLDGVITAHDAYVAQRIADGLDRTDENSLTFFNADINGDGVVTDDEVAYILNLATGLNPDQIIAIDTDVLEEAGDLPASKSGIELRPLAFDYFSHDFTAAVVLTDAVGASSGTFDFAYDTKNVAFVSAEPADLGNLGKVSAGLRDIDGELTCAVSFESPKSVTAAMCDENGDLTLAVFTFNLKDTRLEKTSFDAGCVHFWVKDDEQFVAPGTFETPDGFFYLPGDADNSRYVTARDARLILRISARLEPIEDDAMFARCDVDKDGRITARDARMVLRFSAKLIHSFEDLTVFEPGLDPELLDLDL